MKKIRVVVIFFVYTTLGVNHGFSEQSFLLAHLHSVGKKFGKFTRFFHLLIGKF
jgi:hypothetical protein